MRKLTARSVPKSLSDEHMANRASLCSVLLKGFRSKHDFRTRLVTVDETLVHYYRPENKDQSRQWVPNYSIYVFKMRMCQRLLKFANQATNRENICFK